jgi:hydrogenase-4 component B
MLFRTYQLDELASLALAAALFHTLNHAAFKSLLFMGAGAILQAAHTRNMEEMGGLIKRMPQTAIFFLVGAVAIAALPPFNGFISEWLTFQALLLSFQIPAREVNLLFALGVAGLALTSGLAAAAFVKAFGISFLALPRSDKAEHAQEAGPAMRAAMAMLTLVCIALGVAPFLILPALTATALAVTGANADLRFDANLLIANNAFASVSPLWLALILLALLAAIPLALRLLRANTRRRYYETWGCGRAVQTARFEYTATAFAYPFKRVFALLYRPIKELDIEFHPESRFFVQTIAYSNAARSVIEDSLYRPLLRVVQWVAHEARVIQSGNVHTYLLYILIALVFLLVITR